MIANGTTDATHSPVADLYGDQAFPDLEQATRPERAAYREAARPEPLPEAAFSLTLKGTIGGHEALLTIRAQTATAFAANVAAVRGMLDAASGPAPAAQPPAPVASPEKPEGWCAVHSVQMGKQSNQRGSWYSHKTVDGWCKGK